MSGVIDFLASLVTVLALGIAGAGLMWLIFMVGLGIFGEFLMPRKPNDDQYTPTREDRP